MPGKTLLGSDSHTPTGGGIGMLAIGAGGLDVAAAMAGEPFFLNMPAIIGVRLTGALTGWAAAKDVILELLRRLSVKGGVGRVFEYFGPGVATLSVPGRAAITSMGAELGATSSLFPSDERPQFLALGSAGTPGGRLRREARRRQVIEIDLSRSSRWSRAAPDKVYRCASCPAPSIRCASAVARTPRFAT